MRSKRMVLIFLTIALFVLCGNSLAYAAAPYHIGIVTDCFSRRRSASGGRKAYRGIRRRD